MICMGKNSEKYRRIRAKKINEKMGNRKLMIDRQLSSVEDRILRFLFLFVFLFFSLTFSTAFTEGELWSILEIPHIPLKKEKKAGRRIREEERDCE